MRFKRLEIENFGVFSGDQSFDLSTSSPSRSLIIFGGKNGTGKSTLLEALKICLYGRGFKGRKLPKNEYNKHLRQRLHRNVDGSRAECASVTLEFDYARGGHLDDFLVRRSWKSTEADLSELLEVKQNNELLTDINEEQWQDFLLELVPPGLSKLFFFDGEKIQSLARGLEDNQHIIDSINSLLGVDLIERLRYDIKIYHARESSNIGNSLENKVAEIEGRLKSIKDKLDSLLQEQASIQTKIMRVNSEIENLELKISAEGGGFASKRDQLKQEQKQIEERINSIKEEIRSLSAGLLPFAYVPELCQKLRNRLEHEEKAQQRQATLIYLETAVDELTKDIGNTLFLDSLNLSSEEKQLVASETIKALKNKIERMNGQAKEIIHQVSPMERHDMVKWIKIALTETPVKLKELSSQLSSLEVENEKIGGYIFSAPSDDVLSPLFARLGELHEELGMLQQQYASFQREIGSLKVQLNLTMQEQTNVLEEKDQYDRTKTKLQLAIKTQEVLKEYLERLRAEKVDEFQANFLECFNILFGKKNLVDSVNIAPSTFDISLFTKQGIRISKAELSTGEKQIYAMAMIWALARTSGRQLPFIIDTPLGRLDTEHRSNIMKSFLINASNQVIVFSTNTEIDQQYFTQLQPHIAKAYNLEYNPTERETKVKEGYFWEEIRSEPNEF
jgi:DNA sulfur modification protein DndD